MTNFQLGKLNVSSGQLKQLGKDCQKWAIKNKDKIATGTTAAIIVPAGVYQTANDYNSANKHEKGNVLFNNALMMGGTIGGGCAGYALLTKFLKPHPLGNQWLHTMAVPIGAVIGGVVSGLVAEKAFPVKSLKRDLNLEEKLNLLSTFDYEDISKATNNKPVLWGSVLDNGLGTLAGYQVARESGFENKINKGTHTVISTAIAGAITFLTTHIIQKYKANNQMNNKLALPTIIVASGIACMIGNSVANWINNKLTNKLLKVKILKQIEKNRKALLKHAINNFQDQQEKIRVLTGLSRLKKTSKYLEKMDKKKHTKPKSIVAKVKKTEKKPEPKIEATKKEVNAPSEKLETGKDSKDKVDIQKASKDT